MSYSGYIQFLCQNGHHWTCDCYDYSESENTCPICNSEPIWENNVNTTNGKHELCFSRNEKSILCKNKIQNINRETWNAWIDHEDGYWYGYNVNSKIVKLFKAKRIDGYIKLEIDKEEIKEKCPTCGHEIIKQHRTYKIPKKKEK